MDEINNALKQYKLTQTQINDFIKYFRYAEKNGVPYPFAFAISKIFI